MSISDLWKNSGMDLELSSLIRGVDDTALSSSCVDAKSVLKATKSFTNDKHSLPPNASITVQELYPLLQQLQYESRSLSLTELESLIKGMKRGTNCPPSTYNFTLSYENNTTPTMCNEEYRKMNHLTSDTELPSNINTTDGTDLYGTTGFSNYFTNNFTLSSRRSYKTNGSNDTTCRLSMANENPSVNDNSFNYKNEFLTAFQPGNEYYNDYKTVETPVINNKGAVSPFSWEKTNFNYTPVNLWSNSYKNFNSPIKSVLNTDNVYNNTLSSTPLRPFYNYL